MSISAVRSNNVSTSGIDLSKIASKVASKMMKDLDTNQDGSIDKQEFVTGLSAKGFSTEDAAKQFDAIDTNKTGKITQTDIESAIKSGNVKPSASQRSAGEARPPHGAPPAGGAGGDSSSQTYDPADTNQDGTVSAQEALLYSVTHNNITTKTETAQIGKTIDTTA